MSDPASETPELDSSFDVDELGLLAIRAKTAANNCSREPHDFDLERAYDDLAHQLTVVQALEIRSKLLNPALPPPSDHVDAPETPEAIAAESEGEEPVEEPPEAVGAVAFKVRPKTAQRWCSVCGVQQWKSPGGWVCDNGHGGAGRAHMPKCEFCFEDMTPTVDEDTGTLLSVHCKCGSSKAFAEIADPGA